MNKIYEAKVLAQTETGLLLEEIFNPLSISFSKENNTGEFSVSNYDEQKFILKSVCNRKDYDFKFDSEFIRAFSVKTSDSSNSDEAFVYGGVIQIFDTTEEQYTPEELKTIYHAMSILCASNSERVNAFAKDISTQIK